MTIQYSKSQHINAWYKSRPILAPPTNQTHMYILKAIMIKRYCTFVILLSTATSCLACSNFLGPQDDLMERVNHFNKRVILPRINSLVNIDFFKYVKLNLNRPCKLWPDASKCNRQDCAVNIFSNCSFDELSFVNTSTELSQDPSNELVKLFECDYDDDEDSQYVDLTINPERFTGYSGSSAHRVWRAIYDENCFARLNTPHDMCFEERLFYEAISGLHTSISIHICATYPSLAMLGTFEPNKAEFKRRFDGHPEYIRNLYSLFILELRSLLKIRNYLLEKVRWPDEVTKAAIENLLTTASKLDVLQDQRDLSLQPNDISHDIARHFRNITTTILDCAACDKCKLWGKVQLRGLGAAFKISAIKDLDSLYLNHQELVSLINGLARLSHSLRHLETFVL